MEKEKIEKDLLSQTSAISKAEREAREAQEQKEALAKEIEALKEQLAAAEKEKVIEVAPAVGASDAEIKAIKKEAVEKAKAKAEKLIAEKEQELSKAKADAEFAKAAVEREKKRAEALEKELRAADPAIAQFKGYFAAFQDAYQNCRGQIEIIRKSDPEKAEKLEQAMKAVMEG
jgi:colicin import membrane protein